MRFKAEVALVDSTAEVEQKQETAKAKELLLKAFDILSKRDSSNMPSLIC